MIVNIDFSIKYPSYDNISRFISSSDKESQPIPIWITGSRNGQL